MRCAIGLAFVLGACAAAPPPAAPRPAPRAADLVLVGGTVLTMDPLRPRADGVAIVDGHVDFVGSAAEVRRHIGPATRLVELEGRAVSPGLVDAHSHLYGLGQALEAVDLRATTSPQAVASLVKEAGAGKPADAWVVGHGWDQNLWKVREFPPGGILDGVKNPVVLQRIDGHSIWVNGAALRAAGIDKTTKDPAGGRIVRDARGAATGVLVDAAMALVRDKMPAPDAATIARQILAGQEVALAAGLTGVSDMGIEDNVIAVYRQLAAEGKLRLRVYAMLTGPPHIAELPTRHPDRDPDGTALFVLGGVKMYADGSLGSRSAVLLAPYADDPKNSGLVLNDVAALTLAARNCLAGGWQLAVHAIGDRGNRNVLDAYREAGVTAERRFRIEHAQIVEPGDIRRFAAQGVIASMQPTHATSDMGFAEARVGKDRVKGAYAWRSMLSAGVHLAFGSDFPVEDVPPLNGLYAAVTRQDRDGKPEGGWLPAERLTLDEAIRAYTVEAAYASFQEKHRGQIAPGFVADLTVYDRDLVAEHIADVKVAMTIVGGHIVHGDGSVGGGGVK